MNEFVDMHVHSKFSIDGMSTMEDYCLIAGKTGTRVICFTEHVDFNSAEKNLSIVKDNRKQNFVVDDYFREINRLRKKYGSLTLLSGIEFSEPSLFPEEFALYSSYPFDCITAGIHHCYNSVFPGAGNLSVSKAIYEYYQIMQKTVELGGFQVLAHLDFPKLFFDKWVIDDDVLERHCKAAGIPVISVHGLRHTHASLLLFDGVSIASVAQRLGHSSINTTQKTYLHIIRELENKDIDLIMKSISSLLD